MADSLGKMATLDRWRAAIGLIYEQEKSARRDPALERVNKVVALRCGIRF